MPVTRWGKKYAKFLVVKFSPPATATAIATTTTTTTTTTTANNNDNNNNNNNTVHLAPCPMCVAGSFHVGECYDVRKRNSYPCSAKCEETLEIRHHSPIRYAVPGAIIN